MPPSYKLHYFDARGRAEVARLVFSAAGKQFEDCRYTKESWAAFKPKTPFGQVPCLEVDGVLYGQSGAIFSFLAREFGLYGNGNMQALQVDVVLGLANDFVKVMVQIYLEQDEGKKKEISDKMISEDAPKYLAIFEKLVGKESFFAGNKISLADIAVFDLVDNIITKKADILSSYPHLTANRKLVESNKGIATYLLKRK